MSNAEKMVGEDLIRAILGNAAQGYFSKDHGDQLRAILDQPARQGQGEPVALPARKSYEESFSVHGQGQIMGWNAYREAMEKLGPLYTLPAPVKGEPVAWQYRVTAGPATGWSFWNYGKGEEFKAHYTVETRPLYAHADPAEVERLRKELRIARAQGRAEVVEMIIALEAETGLDEFIGSHQIGCTGEWGSHWKEEALRQHFDVDPAAAGELELARHSSYEIMLFEEERDALRAQLAETNTLLREASEWIKANSFHGTDAVDLWERIDCLISASAEPEVKS